MEHRHRVKMSQRKAFLVSFLLMISGVVADDNWKVIYKLNSICAVKGSTVIMRCSYSYPANYTVEKAFWSAAMMKKGTEPPDLASDPAYRNRAEYIGDKEQDCSLRLKDVSEQDQRKFYFRFLTQKQDGKFQGEDGVELSVTELRVEVPERVVEGVAVTLTCKSTCTLTDQTFTWYNNELMISSDTKSFTLESVSRENGGSYSCAAEGHRSPAVPLNVEYPPESVFVSISPSGEIMEGGSVTLTCSSEANPPVQNNDYFWYKRNFYGRRGRTFTINKLSPEHTGNYYCKASNKHGEKRSTDVSLNVLYPPKNFLVFIRPSADILEGGSVTLTCSSDANPPVKDCTWFKGSSFKGNGNIYIMNNINFEDSGDYKCKCIYRAQEKYSAAATLNVLYPPKTVTVSISPSGEKVEGGSVTLTCSSDANPPVQNSEYVWYKRNFYGRRGTGSTLKINKLSPEHTGIYYCKASNKLGEKRSTDVSLNVLYPPKNVLVFIRPSADILEGGSVTLTCSSDANPPVKDCSWLKGRSFKGNGNIYTMNNISFEDSGDYRCKCIYRAQEKYSAAATLNVLYPPKTVTVSISPSGEKVEGGSVTLTCSSDANPPVQNYSWYREGESSPVGSGQSYNVLQTGSYHCVARNKYGSAAAAPLTLSGGSNGVLLGVLVVVAGCLIALILAFFIWRRRRRDSAEQKSNQENEYSYVKARPSTNNPASAPDLSSQDEDQYVNVWAPSKIPFSTDQRCHDGLANNPQEDDTEYATIKFPQKGAASRSAALEAEADLSVIYSSVK